MCNPLVKHVVALWRLLLSLLSIIVLKCNEDFISGIICHEYSWFTWFSVRVTQNETIVVSNQPTLAACEYKKKSNVWLAVSLMNLLVCTDVVEVVTQVTSVSQQAGSLFRNGAGVVGWWMDGKLRNKTRIYQAQVHWNKATRRPPRVSCDGSAPTIVWREGSSCSGSFLQSERT